MRAIINYRNIKKVALFALILLVLCSLYFIANNKAKIAYYRNNVIHYVDNYFNFSGSSKVIIQGVKRSNEVNIKKILNELKTDSIKYSSTSSINKITAKIKQTEKWIDSIHIFRTLPNSLNVRITEYSPFAIWNDGDDNYVVDSNGNKIPVENINEFDGLLILSGRDAYSHVKSLFNLMVINPDISSLIYSAAWVSDRRWDLTLDNSVLVKLPAEKISDSWSKLVEIYNQEGSFYNLKSIDLRVKGKIYLEYKTL